MSLPPDFQITNALLWQGAVGFALIDAVLLLLLVRLIPRAAFRHLRWPLVGVAAAFWGLLWWWVLGAFWDSVYRYVFPAWAQATLPFAFGLLNGAVALAFWHGALRLRGNPVLNFCLFCGAWGAATHVFAVGRGIVTKPPMLQGAAPAAAITIAIPEYICYWCAILASARLLQWSEQRMRRSRLAGARGG